MSSFKFIETEIRDLYVIEPIIHGDNRGYFMETYVKSVFDTAGLNYCFVQDNQSRSSKGVLRGMHFQKNFPQTKLIRVLDGEIFDVAIDLRKNSKSYRKWFGVVLSEENKKQLLVPRGFAHGFMVLSDYAEIAYKCDDYYHPEDECGIIYNDTDIAIQWPSIEKVILSDKDKMYSNLAKLESTW